MKERKHKFRKDELKRRRKLVKKNIKIEEKVYEK